MSPLSHNRPHKHTCYIIYYDFCLSLLSVNLISPPSPQNVTLSRLMTLLLVLIIAEPSTASRSCDKNANFLNLNFKMWLRKSWVRFQNSNAPSGFLNQMPSFHRIQTAVGMIVFFQSLAKQILRLSAIKWVFKPAIWESWSNLHDYGCLKLSEGCKDLISRYASYRAVELYP